MLVHNYEGIVAGAMTRLDYFSTVDIEGEVLSERLLFVSKEDSTCNLLNVN